MKLAILASGNGTTTQAVIQACRSGALLRSSIVAIVTNDPNAGVLNRARANNIPFKVCANDEETVNFLSQFEIDYVLTLGYFKRVKQTLLRAYPNRILNSHPSLLPDFGGWGMYGDVVHNKVWQSGVQMTGATVHYVDEGLDTGPKLGQIQVPIDGADTPKSIKAKVQKVEKVLLIYVLNRLRILQEQVAPLSKLPKPRQVAGNQSLGSQ